MTTPPTRAAAFGAILFGDVARYLAPQLAFLFKVGAASLIGGLSGHPFALFGFVCVIRADGHGARVGPRRLTSLVKIEQSANWRGLPRSNPDHATRRAFLAAHLSLQFLDLLFELNNDARKLIKTSAYSFDRFSGGLVWWRHLFRPCTHGYGSMTRAGLVELAAKIGEHQFVAH
jgi:hypothetical protein